MAKKRYRAGLAALLALFVVSAAGGTALRAQERPLSDEQFISSLGGTESGPLDRKRLARLWFGIASTLDAGRGALGFLHGRVVVQETSGAEVRRLLEGRLAEYSAAVTGFKGSASAFLDQPESLLAWYQALLDGQRACWLLDVHQRLVETYGANAADLMSVAGSREACTQLRTAAFKPRVESIVRGALVEQVYQRDELRRLQQQVAEMERLVEELAGIEPAP